MWDWGISKPLCSSKTPVTVQGKASKKCLFPFSVHWSWQEPDADKEGYFWAHQNFTNNKCGLQFTAPGIRMWVFMLYSIQQGTELASQSLRKAFPG